MADIQTKLMLLNELIEDKLFFNSILDKLLLLAQEKHLSRLKRYEADLKEFEARYRMPSDSFYEKFEAGKLGDATDFFEWSGLIDMRRDLLNQLNHPEMPDERGR